MFSPLRDCFLALAVCVAACSSSSNTPPLESTPVCSDVDASKAACAVDGGLSYAVVKPIIVKSCVPCHDDSQVDGGNWPLTNYDDVAEWTGPIKDDILNCTMPPFDGGVPISAHDRDMIVQWLLCNAPM